MKISEIEGIGPQLSEILGKAQVKTVEKLLQKGANKKGRQELASTTGIDEKKLLCFVNHADLMRIKGVGGEYSELLEAAGVDTVVELSHRKAENLHEALLKVNAEKKLVRNVASTAQVAAWIEQAKQLPRIVTH